MQKNSVEILAKNEILKWSFKLAGENPIELVHHPKSLNKQVRVIGLENALDPCIKVIEVEIIWHFLFLLIDYLKIRVY